MKKILEILDYRIETPELYGMFHIMSLIITGLLAYNFVKKLKTKDDKYLSKILLTTSLVLIISEIYKQVIMGYHIGKIDINKFPFQFCSVPMYVMFVGSFSKEGKFRNALIAFLGTFSLFAGLAVMIYPGDVFTSTLGISVQTMIHHGAMVFVGIGILVSYMEGNVGEYISASVVFLVMILLALTMNGVYNVITLNRPDAPVFNMFFINPKYKNRLVILTDIQALLPKTTFFKFVFILIYYFGFNFVSYLVFLPKRISYSIESRKKSKLILNKV